MHFLRSETNLFFWILNKSFPFSLDGYFQNLFLKRLRLYISFLNSFLAEHAFEQL